MINVDADQAIADRAVNERCGNGGVDPAREGAEDAIGGAHLSGDGGDSVLSNAPRGPAGRRLGNVVDEVAQQALAARGVHHLGVELNPPEIPRDVGKGGKRGGVGLGDRRETSWGLRDGVTVAHPDAGAPTIARNTSKQQI